MFLTNFLSSVCFLRFVNNFSWGLWSRLVVCDSFDSSLDFKRPKPVRYYLFDL